MVTARRLAVGLGCALALAALAPRIDAESAQAVRLVQAAEQGGASAQSPAYTLSPDKLVKAKALGRIRDVLGFGGALWDLGVLWALLATGAAAGLGRWAGRLGRRRWVQRLVFFEVLLVVLAAVDIPLAWYGHHVSLAYGISVQGWGGWLGDQAKWLGISLGLAGPVMLLFEWIVRRAPRSYWAWGWLAAVVLMVLGALAEPLAEGIFYEFEPLGKTNPALVAELEKLVARTGIAIPPERMFLMKASAKTNGLNAYVSGLGSTKRIVVWDTTVGRIPDDEILFTFGHEMGHYAMNHVLKGLAAGALGMLPGFWICAGVAGWLVRRFGPRWGVETLGCAPGFVVLLLTVSVGGFLTEPVTNAVSRHIEHAADVYGEEAIHGVVADPQKTAVRALDDLGAAWLDDPQPNRFIVFWMYSHPPIEDRAEFARGYDPWANGGRGKYFAK